jgi:CRP/FNR family transcriptional regulator, cyclic AMP receptor protein
MDDAISQRSAPKSVDGTLFGQPVSEPLRYLVGRYPFPARLNQQQLRQLQHSGRAKWIGKGEILFREGELPRALCIVLEGRVKKSITSSRGRTLVIGFSGPGTVIGLEANILGRAYMVTAETVRLTLVIAVPRSELVREIRTNSAAAWLVTQLVCENSYFLAGKLSSVGLSESAPQSVARCLMELGASRPNGERDRARLDLSQETIAQLLGLSRETVSRQLARFRRAGLLEWDRSNFVIRDREALEKIAELPNAAA